MEILATHTDITAKVIVCIILTIIALFFILGAIGGYMSREPINATLMLLVGLVFLALWFAPVTTYYDVTVTDWNVVYDQGYEVVEQNGKIVTLRKVGD